MYECGVENECGLRRGESSLARSPRLRLHATHLRPLLPLARLRDFVESTTWRTERIRDCSDIPKQSPDQEELKMP